MVYLSVKKDGMTKSERQMLMFSGIATIIYNGFNYLKENGKLNA